MRGPWLAGALVLEACAPEPIAIDLPSLGEAASMIVAVERPGAEPPVIELVASPAPEQGEVRLPSAIAAYEDHERVAVTVIGFAEPLETIGLSPGVIERSSDPAALVLDELGAVVSRRRIEVVAGALGAWTEETTLAPPLSELAVLVAGDRRCVRIRTRPLAHNATTAASFALAIDAETAWLGIEGQRILAVKPDGLWYDVTPAGMGPPPTWAAFKEADDLVWLSGREGQLWQVRLGAGGRIAEVLARYQSDEIVTTRTPPIYDHPPRFRWIAGARTGTTVEAHLLSVEGVLARFDGARIRTLHRFEERGTDWRGGIVRLGPGRALAAFLASPDLALVEGDRVTLVRLNTRELSGVTGVGFVPGIGALASDAAGTIYRSDDGATWSEIGTSHGGLGVDSFVPFGPDFLVGGKGGLLQQWRSSLSRFCPPVPPPVRQAIRFMAPLGGSFLASGTLPDDTPPLTISLFDPE